MTPADIEDTNVVDFCAEELQAEAPAETAPLPAKPLAERAAEWQEKAATTVEEAILNATLGDEPVDEIAGVPVYAFTVARGSILRKIGSEFVQGVALSAIADPFLSAGKFVVIMSLPLSDARKISRDNDKLEDQAYALMDKIKFNQVESLVKDINAFIASQLANQVYGEPMKPEGDAPAADGPKN